MNKEFSITDFVDVIMKSGMPKATKIRQIKTRPKYNPASDYYKQIRDSIVSMHKDESDISLFQNLLHKISDKKKNNYSSLIRGYKKWIPKKNIAWFSPPCANYEYRDVRIRIKPELGLMINGTPHVIKLYFKDDKLLKNRADIVTGLMSDKLPDKASTKAILDVRTGKLFTSNCTDKKLMAMVNAEMSYISDLWDDL